METSPEKLNGWKGSATCERECAWPGFVWGANRVELLTMLVERVVCWVLLRIGWGWGLRSQVVGLGMVGWKEGWDDSGPRECSRTDVKVSVCCSSATDEEIIISWVQFSFRNRVP